MNAYQNLNNAMAAGTVAALLAGSFKPAIPPSEQPLTFWLFVAFLCLMRLKIHLDDRKYFETAETKSPHFKIGFIIAVISWMLWSYSAYSVGSLREAYYFAGIAILVSTVWIVVVAIRAGAYREQYVWLGTNALYVLLLWTLYRLNGSQNAWYSWLLSALLLTVLVYDLVVSKSLPELEK